MLKIFGNSSETVSWVPEPTTRGTFTILSSCLITILLCVWTAVHLNIPEAKDEKRPWIIKRQLWRKFSWLFFTLLAPELVAYTAFCQYNLAQRLRRKLSKPKPNGPNRVISLTEAFYAIMGGYVISVFEADDFCPFPDGRTRFLLQDETIIEVAHFYPELLQLTPEHEIRDKSKASGVAKSIACVQASWFALQCLSRMVLTFPITLLELNTFGHSLCALLIYIFWWSKPLDIERPTLLTGRKMETLAAYLWLVSMDVKLKDHRKSYPRSHPGGNRTAIRIKSTESGHRHRYIEFTILRKVRSPDAPENIVRLATDALARHHKYYKKNKLGKREILDRVPDFPKGGFLLDGSISDNLNRWTHDLRLCWYTSGFIYGGLHALAWNASFHSFVEKVIWRLSSLVIVTSALVIDGSLRLISYVISRRDSESEEHRRSCTGIWLRIALFSLKVIVYTDLAAYFLARLYLIVECFISLTHSPFGVYDVPFWSNYLPHIP